MIALDPAFDEANYGFSRFRHLLSHRGHRVQTVGHSGSDITIALRHVKSVNYDRPSQRGAGPDLGKQLSTQDIASQDFPRMTSADHLNQQHPTSTSTQVSVGEG
jgi:hypothetical protein